MSRTSLQKAISIIQREPPAAAVFDVDSTIFCMKYRTGAIIKDCALNKSFRKAFPKDADKIHGIHVTERDWSVEEILAKSGFPDPEAPVVKAVSRFWRAAFFTNKYLHLDQPYKGCAEFIKTVQKSGGGVFYLTARQKRDMWEGTLQSLKRHGFPLPQKERLILKPDHEESDAEYKTGELRRIAKKFPAVLFFENEPVILNAVAGALPKVRLFWMDSAHSRREQPPSKAEPLSMNYCF